MSYLSQKDKNLIFNAVGRVWPRTERYKNLLAIMREPDEGPRGKWWYPCSSCGERFRQANIQLDHIDPVVPLDKKRIEMNLLEYIERKFLCPKQNFQVLCKPCHQAKTNQEKSTRMVRTRSLDTTK